MPMLLEQYLPILIFIALSAIISGALLIAPFLLAFKAPDPEKLSAYDCGVNPCNDSRMKFDVRCYLVSLGSLRSASSICGAKEHWNGIDRDFWRRAGCSAGQGTD